MEKKYLLLVGCGNLGSRHLQGIVKISTPLDISVVEPNQNAIQIAKERLNKISHNDHTITWFNDVDDVKQNSDLTIISTNSSGRSALIRQLLKKEHSRFLIEKIVCQSNKEYTSLIDEMKIHNAKGWVDTSRRYFSFYKTIKEHFSKINSIHLSVKCGNIGLGTNAIHFLDLFLWFANTTDIILTSDLNDKILSNKRGKNFVEFAGTIKGKTNSGSTITISSSLENDLPIVVDIMANDKKITIDETNQNIIECKNLPEILFKWEYQSDLTTKIVNDLLANDKCSLPLLSDSFTLHTELFRIFNNHIYKILDKEPLLCPIT